VVIVHAARRSSTARFDFANVLPINHELAEEKFKKLKGKVFEQRKKKWLCTVFFIFRTHKNFSFPQRFSQVKKISKVIVEFILCVSMSQDVDIGHVTGDAEEFRRHADE
jgi:hypothetical protein